MPQVQFENNLLTVTGSLNDTSYRLTGAVSASGDNPRLDYSPPGPYTVTFESEVFVGCDEPEPPLLFEYNPDSVSAPADPTSYTAIIEGPSPPYEIYVSRNGGDDYATPILSEGYLSFSVDGPPDDYSEGVCEGGITFSANNISGEFKISGLDALADIVFDKDQWIGDRRYYSLVRIFPTTQSSFPDAYFGVREKESSGLEYFIAADNMAEEQYVVGDVAEGDVVTVQVTPVSGGVEFKVNGTPYTVDVEHQARVELWYGGMYRWDSGTGIPSYDHAVGLRNIVVEDL